MQFDEQLIYGLVLTPLPNHEWWHGHLVRSNLRYFCELLSGETTMLFMTQKFGQGGVPLTANFFVTLDGDGVTGITDLRWTAEWGELSGTDEEKAVALDIREKILPILHDDRKFQHAIWFIVMRDEHENLVDLDQMEQIAVPPFWPERFP